MFTKALLTIAALGVVSAWYLRSQPTPLRRGNARLAALKPYRSTASPAHAESLQYSYARRVADQIEGATGDIEEPGEATDESKEIIWPASREFLRGA
jgi:hypothetical protein